jgi:phage head maturation protease
MPHHDGRSLRHWHPGLTETRLASLAPGTYDKKARTVDAVLSVGSPVKRFYGTEVLRIDDESVDLARLKQGGVPVLDSHNQQGISSALGRVKQAWISRGALMGKLSFHQTPEGRKAEGMVARGEITGVSAGYRVEDWEITDGEGRVLDPELDRIRWDDDLTFTATRWELLEASLVAVPADASASIRSSGDRALTFPSIFQSRNADVRMRMNIRQAMHRRAAER